MEAREENDDELTGPLPPQVELARDLPLDNNTGLYAPAYA